jgi:hypothetical protein
MTAQKTVRRPPSWSQCPWRDFLPGRLPEDWQPIDSDVFTAFSRADDLHVVVSVNTEADGKRWLHVSASYADRVPTYDELCEVKRLFIGNGRHALSLYPRFDEHVNHHPFVLHLWSCLDGHPLPDFRVPLSDGSLTI